MAILQFKGHNIIESKNKFKATSSQHSPRAWSYNVHLPLSCIKIEVGIKNKLEKKYLYIEVLILPSCSYVNPRENETRKASIKPPETKRKCMKCVSPISKLSSTMVRIQDFRPSLKENCKKSDQEKP